ncbi:MAG: hypothetical protein AAFN74_04810 [Myxococcota bacterium]
MSGPLKSKKHLQPIEIPNALGQQGSSGSSVQKSNASAASKGGPSVLKAVDQVTRKDAATLRPAWAIDAQNIGPKDPPVKANSVGGNVVRAKLGGHFEPIVFGSPKPTTGVFGKSTLAVVQKTEDPPSKIDFRRSEATGLTLQALLPQASIDTRRKAVDQFKSWSLLGEKDSTVSRADARQALALYQTEKQRKKPDPRILRDLESLLIESLSDNSDSTFKRQMSKAIADDPTAAVSARVSAFVESAKQRGAFRARCFA